MSGVQLDANLLLPFLENELIKRRLTDCRTKTKNKNRGSTFLKRWMEYLEDEADLRYPDLASLTATTNSSSRLI